MSKVLTSESGFVRRVVTAPSYAINARHSPKRLFVPVKDDTLMRSSVPSEKTDRGRYAEAFFRINDVVHEQEDFDEYLL